LFGLYSFSRSEIRPFRHTSTFTTLAIGRTLSSIAANLTSQVTTIDRQLKAEKKKKESASSTKVKDLEKKSHQLNGQIKTIEKYLEKIFEEYITLHPSV
jgi:cohesin complex subunit SA-1/2